MTKRFAVCGPRFSAPGLRFAVSCLLSSILWCLPPAFAAPPNGVHATYDGYKDFLQIEIRENYTRNQDHYTITSVWSPVGLLAALKPERILMDSSGLVVKNGLQPQLYSYRREKDTNKNKLAEFDWQGRKITMEHQGQRNVAALPESAQDRLSAMYQFMFLSLADADTLDFAMTDGNKLDNYHYAIMRNQTIRVPAGEFKTVYLDSQAKHGESRTEIWLAVEHNYLPCKMIVTEANGNVFTQVLSRLEIRP